MKLEALFGKILGSEKPLGSGNLGGSLDLASNLSCRGPLTLT
jgi:hypothetical protein